jgi:Sec-independent protein secretion pathway component TatC
MLFVIFTFWSTGPLVGVMVGYLLGMSTRLTFTTVIVGDIIAVAAWTWGYDKLYNHNRQFAIILLIIIFALAIGGAVYANIRKRKN